MSRTRSPIGARRWHVPEEELRRAVDAVGADGNGSAPASGHEVTDLLQFSVSPLELIVQGRLGDVLVLVPGLPPSSCAATWGSRRHRRRALARADRRRGPERHGGWLHPSIAEGFLSLVSTLLGWNYALDRLAYYLRRPFEIHRAQATLADRGRRKVLARNLRREFITRDDLEAQLRRNGVFVPRRREGGGSPSDGSSRVVLRRPAVANAGARGMAFPERGDTGQARPPEHRQTTGLADAEAGKQAQQFRQRLVGRVGLEPTTKGL